jgi:hypothetical protein
MFQYAIGRGLKARGREVTYSKFNLLEPSGEPHHRDRPQYGMDGFDTTITWGEPVGDVISDWDMVFKQEIFDVDNVTLYGHWQNEEYFMNVWEEIRWALKPKIVKHSLEPNSISVHVRRGDYLDAVNLKYHGVMDEDYYCRAVDYIYDFYPRMPVFVFSDDPKWSMEAFAYRGWNIVNTNDRWWDIYLMSQCKHHVISRSTFGWWGAWLGEQGGITVAPKSWFVEGMYPGNHVVPDRWIRL